MPPKPKHRDVAPFLNRVREFLLGRTHITNNRYADTIAPRTQPPPNIPGGPQQPLHNVYYYMRDPRGVVRPPIDLIAEQKRQIAAKAKAKVEAAKGASNQDGKPQQICPENDEKKNENESEDVKKLPTPGKMHSWD